MSFKHKLSSRLALLKDAPWRVALVALVTACELPVASPTGLTSSVVQVIVVPDTLSVYPAQQVKFAAYGRTASGDSSAVTASWTATGGSIASDGMFVADTATGDFSVTATNATLKLSGSSRVHIRPRPVASVAIAPASASVPVGQTIQLTATPRDVNGNALTGRVVTWGSSNAAVATVNASGLVSAIAAGSATITATSEGKSGSAAMTVSPAAVASVTLSPTLASVTVGQTVQLTATPRDANGNPLAGRVVTWASSNTGVATVNGSGLVTAVAAGPTIITATSEGKNGTAGITVTTTPAVVASVSVTPASANVTVGQTVQLTATPRDASGNVLSGRVVTWASSNGALATVSGSGLVTGVAAGGATITATIEGQSGSSAVTVMVPVASVGVSPASPSVTAGQTVQLTATPRDASGNALTGRVVTWGSGNPAVATVNGSGLVTGMTAGSATITATSEGRSGTAAVTVAPAPVATVSVSPAAPSVTVGQTVQLTATPRDASGNPLSGRVVTWSSNNTGVATVNGSGLVTAVAAGSATITATSEGKSGTAGVTTTPPASGADTIVYQGFESGSLAGWDDVYDSGLKAGGAARFTVAGPNQALAKTGSYALRGDYPAGAYPGAISKFFMPGSDHLRGSMWFKLASGWTAGTKLFLLRGSRIDNQWSSFGTAGLCPSGSDFFVTDVTFDAARGLEFYTYYVGQGKESDGVTCYGRNGLQASPPATYQGTRFPSVDSWHLLEFEVQLNTPGSADGWQKFWLDGALIGTWNGIVFRTTTDLRLNAVTVELSAATVSQPRTIYIDDVLVTAP